MAEPTRKATKRRILKGRTHPPGIESIFAGSLRGAGVLGGPSDLVYANAATSDVYERIGEVSDWLAAVMTQVAKSNGLPLVIDTNVILEYEPIQTIDWSALVGDPARLIVPLRVLEELEESRYSKSKVKSKIARAELPRIVKLLEANPGEPASIGSDATIELFDLRREGLRPSWADDEILEFLTMLKQFLADVRLVT